jgi:hypothetical protein
MDPDVPGDAPIAVVGRYSLLWKSLGFALHLAVVYLIANFCIAWLAGLVHNIVLPAIGLPSGVSRFQFLFSHLLLLSILCGLVGGLITAKYNHRVAQYVWAVPLAVLAYKIATFPVSVLQGQLGVAFHHYLGGGFLVPEFRTYHEMFSLVADPDMQRGMDQMQATAPVYVGIAYGIANWVGIRMKISIPGPGSLFPKVSSLDYDPPPRTYR